MFELSLTEQRALAVLGFLMFRLGREDSARRYYRALEKLSAPGTAEHRRALAGLAAVAVERGDAAAANSALREAMAGGAISTREGALHLLRAQALWMQGRSQEARAACGEYELIAGRQKDEQ